MSMMRDLIYLIESAQANRIWYHGSDRVFTSFDSAEIGARMGRGSPGFWFTDDPRLTGFYGHIQYAVRLHINNPKIITGDEWNNLKDRSPSYQAVLASMEDHDALIIEDITDGDMESTVCCVFDADDIEIVSREGEEDLTENEMNISQHDEATIFMHLGNGVMEIYGSDDSGWYADKKEIQEWNQEIKDYRRSERLRNKEPEDHAPVPMKATKSKNRIYVYLSKPDGSPVTRDWLTMNGAFLSSEDDE